MRKLLALLILSVLAAPAARADGNIVLSGRVAVAKPFGDLQKDFAFSDIVEWAVPLQADAQFRFSRQLAVGAYARYAAATLRSVQAERQVMTF